MTLIRKVLVMSLKSQTDEHFLAATEEDHPPTLKLPEGIDPSAFTAHGHTRSHKQDPARVWSDHSHILSSIPSSMSTASMSLLPCLLISLSPWCLFAVSHFSIYSSVVVLSVRTPLSNTETLPA